MHHPTPGPPPARDTGTSGPNNVPPSASSRARRSSVPCGTTSSSYRNLNAAVEAALKSEDAHNRASATASPSPSSPPGAPSDRGGMSKASARPHAPHGHSRKDRQSVATTCDGSSSGEFRDIEQSKSARQGSLFSAQQLKREQLEHSELIASIQQNSVALTTLNERERAHNTQLKVQVEQLTAALASMKDAYEEEKLKNEKIAALRMKQKTGGEYTGCLPDIHSSPVPAAATAALQQQTQLEVSYQRRILSLENRTKDLIENNTKLLAKIQQLEKTEADAGAQIDALRNENTRLATQADGLTSTVNSQSSLIIGLRTTMQRLNQEDQQMNALAKKYDRCQIDFEVLKTREKLLRDEYEKLKFVMSKEKEMLMFKILDFQQQLQQRNQIGDAMEAYQSQIQQLDAKQRAWENDMSTLKVASEAAETRLHQQEEMTNRFLLEKQQFEQENNRYQEEIIRKNEELERQQAMVEKLHALSTQSHELNGLLRAQQQEADIAVLAKEKEIDTLMHKCVAQESVIDELQQRIVQMEVETQRLQAEIQKYKQLSQDETVQALQLARLKAANHDALILLEEEKRELEIRIDTLVAQLERERCAHEDDKKAMESTIQFNETRLQKLLDENCMLHEKADAPPLVQIVEKFVEPPTDKIAGDMLQLQVAYDELKQEFAHVESEYKKMVTKKYKTESFQSQVRLLQNENSELASKLGQLFAELSRERAELNTRTRENVELKSRVMDPQAIELLRKTQESLEKTVSSLVEAETSSESSFTCLQCMRLFVEPMTLAPCGHTYCSSCLTKFGDADVPSSIKCKDCHSTNEVLPIPEPDAVFPNHALADLTARFIFRQQSLSSLTTMCLSLRSSFANRASTITS